jgi:hypothetical protein
MQGVRHSRMRGKMSTMPRQGNTAIRKTSGKQIERPWLAATQFKPGQSGNPTGRPVNLLAKAIRERTQEGLEIAEYMVGVFKGTIEPDRNRVAAATWLAEHGFPKPVEDQESAQSMAGAYLAMLMRAAPEIVRELNRISIASSADQVVDVPSEEVK